MSAPTTTRAAVLTQIGAQAPYAGSRPLSVEELELAAPGPGEALVRIGAAGVCHSDLSVVDGVRPRPVPMALGHEASGWVEAVGPGVRGVEVGQQVVFAFVPSCGNCVPCTSGRPALCEPGAAANTAGSLLSGARPLRRADGTKVHSHLGVSGFATRTVADAASLVPLEDEVPATTAALLGCATLTGIGAVLNTARAEAGSTALVVGLGGVGLSAVMGAAVAGCRRIVAVDLDPAKAELARRVGATDVLTGGDDTDELVAAVRDLTGGGADTAVEAVGHTGALALAYGATARGGTTVSVGLPRPGATFELPALSLVAEERRLVGSYMGSSVPRRDVPRYAALHARGLLPIDALAGDSWPLDEVNEAMDALAGGAVGRQILAIGD